MIFYVCYFMLFEPIERVFSVFDFPTCTYKDNDPWTIFNVIIEVIFRFGMLDLMLLPITVILIKSNSDILQGVSKLDNLMRCSVFQKDKIRIKDKTLSASSSTMNS